MDLFLEDFKTDLLKAKYTLNGEFIGLGEKINGTDIRVNHVRDKSQLSKTVLGIDQEFKVIIIKMDLVCVFENDSNFGEILENIFVDFERSFFSRTETENTVLPKRVFLQRNGIRVSVYLDSDNQLNVS